MNNLIGKFMLIWMHPKDALANIKEEGESAAMAPSLVFVSVMAFLSAGIASIGLVIHPPQMAAGISKPAMFATTMLLLPLLTVVASFLGTLLLWVVVNGALKGTLAEYKTTYRVFAITTAFSPVAALLNLIPMAGVYLGWAVNIWGILILIYGLTVVRETPTLRTWLICGGMFVLLIILAAAARYVSQNPQQFGGRSQFDDFAASDFNDDFNDEGGTDELEKQLKELADKAKADQKSSEPAKK